MAQSAEDTRPWASVIIVNYNAKRFLQDALDALAVQSDRDFEVILVDNDSTDGSIDTLRTDHLPKFRLMALDENTGFAKGNNLAVAVANGHWIALLNPDTRPAPDWIAAFRRATEERPDESVFAGATINMTDPTKLDGAGDCYFGPGLAWRGGYGRPVSELPAPGTCFGPCAAAALYRRETFLAIGGFDERYFCYFEDVDLAFRLNLAGETCVFWPEAKVAHFGSGTTSVASEFSVFHGTRNRIWTFIKNMPPLGFVLLAPIHAVMTVALLVWSLPKGRFRPTWRGVSHGLRRIGSIWNDRKSIQARRKISSLQLFSVMSWNPLRLLMRKPDVRPFKVSSPSNRPASRNGRS